MNSARQIIRWSLPGLVFVLNILIFHGFWLGFITHVSPWAYINEATAPALVAVVAGGLPGGFLIYQIYFHDYRPVGPSLFRRIPLLRFYRQDRGASVLSKYVDTYKGEYSLLVELDQLGSTRQEIDERIHLPVVHPFLIIFARPRGRVHLGTGTGAPHQLKRAAWRCAECARVYERRSDQNWILLQSTIDYCASTPNGKWIKDEYISGSDLYHGFGAARAAVWLALLVATAYDGIVKPLMTTGSFPDIAYQPSNFAGVLITTVVLSVTQVYVLTRSRNQTAQVYHARVASALALVSRKYPVPAARARVPWWPFGRRDAF